MPPCFCKARPVLLALQKKVETEWTWLVYSGILQPVTYSVWPAPIVQVPNRDGTIRICGDYKLTVNVTSQVEHYPPPRIDELFAKLAGGVCFSKLDMSPLRAAGFSRSLPKTCDNQYPPRLVPIQAPSIWCVICVCHYSEGNGRLAGRNRPCCCVPR